MIHHPKIGVLPNHQDQTIFSIETPDLGSPWVPDRICHARLPSSCSTAIWEVGSEDVTKIRWICFGLFCRRVFVLQIARTLAQCR